MRAQSLRSYFVNDQEQRSALGALGDFFDPRELDLYDASQYAFDPSSSEGEAFRHFTKIYYELASPHWGVFRPCSPADCWPPQKIFETIKREFSEFSRSGTVNLLNFSKSGTGLRLQSCLAKMQGIKPKRGYPIMTVSKFLHFYNPGLFPIYDNGVIWDEVMNGVFKYDFREFRDREKIPDSIAGSNAEDTAAFLRYYMIWASSLLSVAHRAFMQVFSDWLAKQPGTELPKRRFDPTRLYARAFEYTAIGAANLP
ncbi:MAG: hypothetical protein ABSC64_03330 [Candidatus Korobacteraceae bacterium]|jgi:hypothetical protein